MPDGFGQKIRFERPALIFKNLSATRKVCMCRFCTHTLCRFDVTRGNPRPIFLVVKLAPHALRVVKLDGTSGELATVEKRLANRQRNGGDSAPRLSCDCRSRSCCTSVACDSWTCRRKKLRKQGVRIVLRARDLRDRANRSLTARSAPSTARARADPGGSFPQSGPSFAREARRPDAFQSSC